MMTKTSLLKNLKDRANSRQAYLQRLASIQRDASGEQPGKSGLEAADGKDRTMARQDESPLHYESTATRTLYWWLARITLVALLVVLLTLVLLPWAPTTQTNRVVEEADPFLRMTAKGSNIAAVAVVREWSEDGQLIGISATWEAGQAIESGEGNWSLLYYSPSRVATALISVYEGEAKLVSTHGLADPLAMQPGLQWEIDSPLAVERFLAAGGAEFLRGQPTASLALSLDLTGDSVWKVRLIDQQSRRVLSARVDIENGEVTGLEQSG